ncbi:LexA family transcriptional regulator [Lelliottia sp. V106_10]|uniref:LexA family protein n=1 Tax=Lelliottia wanjuensis TaxID=3050585 RepID=UPI0025506522|nr:MULTISPECIES: LexA family transcriptional regulator [unclassified Lelliottia]MDK9373395.1 LexA family transcriptional regulator [Lelliottia sp. V106_10]MDK9600188.1 LexA family transcriptional regulator [Lelliottia sp. V106_5]
MSNKALTDRQRQVLAFVRQYLADFGIAPTNKEIASGMGFKSANAAQVHLRALQKKGYLSVRPNVSRGITLAGRNEINLPLTSDVEYWFEGVFQHRRYERDVRKAIEQAGFKVAEVNRGA